MISDDLTGYGNLGQQQIKPPRRRAAFIHFSSMSGTSPVLRRRHAYFDSTGIP